MISSFKLKLLFFFIIIISIFLNLQNIPTRFGYGWDQRRDAQVIADMVDNHKFTLIGPRVVNDDAFFLGPMHYYLLIPFYLGLHDTQLAEIYLACLVSIITCIGFMFVGYKLFNTKVAFFSGLIFALTPATVSWNPMYIPIVSLLSFWSGYKIINKNYKFIVLSSLLFAIGLQSHFTAIFLFIYLIIAILLSNPKDQLRSVMKYLLYGIIIVVVSFLPLVIFDIRHQFINSRSFLSFFFGHQGNLGLNSTPALRNYLRSFSFKYLSTGFGSTLLGITFLSILIMPQVKFKIFTLSWMIIPLIVFSFYHGHISEYYFMVADYVSYLLNIYFLTAIFSDFSLPLIKNLRKKVGYSIFSKTN